MTATLTVQEQLGVRVKDFLKSLGSGPNKIAESLETMKIRGRICDIENCPLAKAVKRNFKGIKGLSVNVDEIYFLYKKEKYIITPPPACSRFIDKFDYGYYPNITSKLDLL